MSEINISKAFEHLKTNLESLTWLLETVKSECLFVSKIPVNGNTKVETIEPETGFNKDAISLIQEAYTGIYRNDGQSPRYSRRYVGLIHIRKDNPLADEIILTVEQVNKYKTIIKECVNKFSSNRFEKADYRELHCPRTVATALYRAIPCYIDKGISKVLFSWQKKVSSQIVSNSELYKRLDELITTSRHKPDFVTAMEKLQNDLNHLEPGRVIEYRPGRVTPVANIFMSSGKKNLPAPIPLLIIQNESIQAKPIHNFINDKERRQRSDKKDRRTIGYYSGIDVYYDPTKPINNDYK